jgi:hypothetical protein
LGALLVQVPATIKDVDDNCIATVVYMRGWAATPGLKKTEKKCGPAEFCGHPQNSNHTNRRYSLENTSA